MWFITKLALVLLYHPILCVIPYDYHNNNDLSFLMLSRKDANVAGANAAGDPNEYLRDGQNSAQGSVAEMCTALTEQWENMNVGSAERVHMLTELLNHCPVTPQFMVSDM